MGTYTKKPSTKKSVKGAYVKKGRTTKAWRATYPKKKTYTTKYKGSYQARPYKRKWYPTKGYKKGYKKITKEKPGMYLTSQLSTEESKRDSMNSFNLLPTNKSYYCPYVSEVQKTTAYGVMSYHVYRMNSINDPDFTSTGTRPFHWTQLNAFFKLYRVSACRVTTTFRWGTSVGERSPVLCFQIPSDLSISLNPGVSEKAEMWASRVKVLQPSLDDVVTLEYWFRVGDFFNMTKEAIGADADTAATFAANPVKVAFLHCGIQSLNFSVATNAPIIMKTKLGFYTTAYEPREPLPALTEVKYSDEITGADTEEMEMEGTPTDDAVLVPAPNTVESLGEQMQRLGRTLSNTMV